MGGRSQLQHDDDGWIWRTRAKTQDHDGWKWKMGSIRNDSERPISDPYQKSVERIASSFYITNFPDYVDAKKLWQEFESFGRIVDAFIASKKSKIGKRFGFLRFIGVKNDEEFAKSLARVWIGNHHVFVSVARFHRKARNEYIPPDRKKKHGYNIEIPKVKEPDTSTFNKKSYASVLNGDSSNNMVREEVKQVSLNDHDLVQFSNSMEAVLVKMKDVQSMPNMKILCEQEGFNGFSINHVGGMWLWIHFNSIDSCNAFKNNLILRSYYTAIKPVNKNFLVDERMIWVEISGLPLCAWKSNAYKKVASSVGRFMFFENDPSAAMSIGRICIATSSKKAVMEVVKVSVQGEVYDACIHELGAWSINLEGEADSSSDSSSNENNSDDGDEASNYDIDSNHIEVSDLSTTRKLEKKEAIHNSSDSKKDTDQSEFSRPPGFEKFTGSSCGRPSSLQSKSTSQGIHKPYRGYSDIQDVHKLKAVGQKLGFEVKENNEVIQRVIDRIGVIMVDK